LSFDTYDRGSILGRGFFHFTTAFKPALGPIQPPIWWIRGGGGSYPGSKVAGTCCWLFTSIYCGG